MRDSGSEEDFLVDFNRPKLTDLLHRGLELAFDSLISHGHVDDQLRGYRIKDLDFGRLVCGVIGSALKLAAIGSVIDLADRSVFEHFFECPGSS